MPRQKSTHVDDPGAVGERLKAARLESGLSQRQLAFPGCSPAYISRIEAGDRIPSLQLLRELGRRLGVSEDFLATGEETQFQTLTMLEAEIALRLDDQPTAQRLYSEALDRAATPRERATAEEGLGHLAVRRGELREAVKLFEDALVASGSAEWERPALAESLARAYATMGELEPSVSILERCLKAFQDRGDTVEAIRFSCLLAAALSDQNEFARAEEVVTNALATGRESLDPYTRARVYWAKAKLRGEQGDADGALRYAYQALAALELTEDLHYTAVAHLLIAQVELERGNAQEALTHLEDGFPIIERTGSPVDRAAFLVEQARAQAKLGHRDEVEALAKQVTDLLSDEEPKEMIGQAYAVLGEVAADDGERDKAISYFETAAEYLEENGSQRHLVDLYARLAETLEAEGRADEAYGYMKRAIAAQQTSAPKRRASA